MIYEIASHTVNKSDQNTRNGTLFIKGKSFLFPETSYAIRDNEDRSRVKDNYEGLIVGIPYDHDLSNKALMFWDIYQLDITPSNYQFEKELITPVRAAEIYDQGLTVSTEDLAGINSSHYAIKWKDTTIGVISVAELTRFSVCLGWHCLAYFRRKLNYGVFIQEARQLFNVDKFFFLTSGCDDHTLFWDQNMTPLKKYMFLENEYLQN